MSAQGIVARIQQGRYDDEKTLLALKENAERLGRIDALDAVHQRLRIVAPKTYQRLVGPLKERIRDKRFRCYCNHPKSLFEIFHDIKADTIPYDALTCDACWNVDISEAWGYYGWAKKLISVDRWRYLCEDRANAKFVE